MRVTWSSGRGTILALVVLPTLITVQGKASASNLTVQPAALHPGTQ